MATNQQEIKCPNCNELISIDDVLTHQTEKKIKIGNSKQKNKMPKQPNFKARSSENLNLGRWVQVKKNGPGRNCTGDPRQVKAMSYQARPRAHKK